MSMSTITSSSSSSSSPQRLAVVAAMAAGSMGGLLLLVALAKTKALRRRRFGASNNNNNNTTTEKKDRKQLPVVGTAVKDEQGGKNKNTNATTTTTTTTTAPEKEDPDVVPAAATAGTTAVDDPPPAVAAAVARRIRANQRLIRSVIQYWFGQFPPAQAQKRLWMIRNAKQIQRVDREIVGRFGLLLLELSADIQDDDEGDEKTWSPSSRWREWCCNDDDDDDSNDSNDNNVSYGWQGKLAAIVVLDQFSRHVHRFLQQQQLQQDEATFDAKNDDTNSDPFAATVQRLRRELPPQAILDARAHATAAALWEGDSSFPLLAPAPMQIFALMPLRHHQATVASVRRTQARTEQLAALQCECEASIRAFRKATNRRLAVLQDEARRTGGGGGVGDSATSSTTDNSSSTTNSNSPNNSHSKTNQDETNTTTTSATTTTTKLFTDDDILECFPFAADMALANEHPVVVTVRDFLAQQGIHPIISEEAPTDTTTTRKTRRRPILVSLSGGVDSMVLAAVLAHLRDRHNSANGDGGGGYPHLRIVAVHIDYANRPESAAEAAYVQRYSREQLRIECRVRRIDEVTRGVTARDDYERVAREIRYTFYRDVIRDCCGDGGDDDDGEHDAVGVVLGHHRGDLRENVLSNAHRGCGPLDLSGMTATSRNDGVALYRPLLPLEKAIVYDYAHKFGVPYFKDTTPHWSTRGKLRNKLLPLLEEIYGEGSMNNLSRLAVESDECRAVFHKLLVQPFLDQIVHFPMGMSFPTAPWRDQGLFFWKLVLREALHSIRLGMFTDKSVLSFTERACGPKIREGWLQCRKDYAVYLQADGRVYVLFPTSFPWHKDDQYKCEGNVEFGMENAVQIGPWTVAAEIAYRDSDSAEARSLIEERAYASMDDFMKGTLTYSVPVPTWETEDGVFEPKPLVFAEFSKRVRPRSWKGLDVKIQETLPILGNDDSAVGALHDPYESGAVHTSADGKLSVNPVMVAKVTLKLPR